MINKELDVLEPINRLYFALNNSFLLVDVCDLLAVYSSREEFKKNGNVGLVSSVLTGGMEVCLEAVVDILGAIVSVLVSILSLDGS